MAAQTERLQKVLAQAGVASRRHAETLIEEGHVAVNGEVVTQMGVKVSSKDEVSVDGVPVGREAKRHFLLYKPRGVITAVTDNKKRRVVTDFFEDYSERIYPVGRLDYDTSGLVIMTNDGDLANMLMHPKFEVDKQYVAKVQGIPTRADLLPLTKGIILDHKKSLRLRLRFFQLIRPRKPRLWNWSFIRG